MNKLIVLGIAVGFAVTCNRLHAQASGIEALVMPGAVSQPHADIEGECSNCHAPFSRNSQTGLCIDCHEPVGNDVNSNTGFHGNSPAARDSGCAVCHTEHNGRAADIVGLDSDTFDHLLTDFKLSGAHRSAPCSGCHLADVKHREAPADCYACHDNDDVHQQNLGQDCAACHSTGAWTGVEFDHNATEFPLEGEHLQAQCAACHVDHLYLATPMECAACHGGDDTHQGLNGQQCANCHTPVSWESARFDHLRETGFALTSGHADKQCGACHSQNPVADELDTACVSCHSSDDRHGGRNGPECGTCHTPSEWANSTFDHSSATQFALRGAHQTLACTSCHRGGPLDEAPGQACVDCHIADDAHDGTLGSECAQCHNEDSWDSRISFDHDLSAFPLIGLHAVAPCEQCHSSSAFSDVASQCSNCHAAEDAHNGILGAACQRCHNPNGWDYWQFDHSVQTQFVLTGAHAGLDCLACHQEPVDGAKPMGKHCAACHQNDDTHSGNFGSDCGQCHTTGSFSETVSAP